MKRVLMTNLYFAKYTGSELHTLEVARLFEKRGYEVTVAVFQKAYPLLERANTIRVVDVLNEDLEEQNFDVVFVQHYPVLDFLCCKYEISYKKLIVSKLSVISELEYLPVCTSKADLILCVSQECANEVYETIGMDSRVRVFKNSVSEEFFQLSNTDKEGNSLRKIAVISNHIPKELLELSQIMGKDYTIDYIGLGHAPRFVDTKLIKQYDLIITIGRTVQQCFALGVPVYVYDYFGGPGYINDDNFIVAEKNNFSGRGGFPQKSSLELKNDILDNYKENCLNLKKLYAIARESYSYNENFECIYQDLMKDGIGEKKNLDCYKGVEKQRIALYSKVAPLYAVSSNIESQFYIDFGRGFKEEDSIKWNVVESYDIRKEIEVQGKVKGLRFDPCDRPTECYIYSITINGSEKEAYSNQKMRLSMFDPQIYIELSEEERNLEHLCIEVSYKFKLFDEQEIRQMYDESQYNLDVSRNCIKDLENTIESIKQYYKMTPKNIIKRVLNAFKR